MIVLAAYDIVADSRRARLAALLQTLGDRVQRSVFMIDIAPADLPQLRERSMQIIDPMADSLFFLHQCAVCWDKLEMLGQAEPPERVLFWSAL